MRKYKLVELNIKPETVIIKNEVKFNSLSRKFKKEYIIDDKTYFYVFTSGSKPSMLYGLRKIRKPNVIIRPILSAFGTINYKDSKFFIPLLTKHHEPVIHK